MPVIIWFERYRKSVSLLFHKDYGTNVNGKVHYFKRVLETPTTFTQEPIESANLAIRRLSLEAETENTFIMCTSKLYIFKLPYKVHEPKFQEKCIHLMKTDVTIPHTPSRPGTEGLVFRAMSTARCWAGMKVVFFSILF